MKPSRQQYARAADLGGQARRNGQKADANPWRKAANEHDRLLRDAWADEWHAEDNRRRKA